MLSKAIAFDLKKENQTAQLLDEIYQMVEHGENKSWKHLMIGYGNEVFYEEPVGELSLKGKDLQQTRHGGDMDAL